MYPETHETARWEANRKAPLGGGALTNPVLNLAQSVFGFQDVALEILNHLRAKLLRDLLS
jgi:hypothetical protein